MWLGLVLFILGILFLTTNPSPVLADVLCGPGYVCWEESGGNAALYGRCTLSDNGAYCQGLSIVTLYCNCTGSPDCSCTIGPPDGGTTCENPIISAPIYVCTVGGAVCTAVAPNSTECPLVYEGTPYEAYSACVFFGTEPTCGDPTGSSTIGCCYGGEPDPTPPPPPPSEPPPPPDGSPVVAVIIQANGSDTDITVSSPYTIAWNSVNAASCTLNGMASNTAGSVLYSSGPGSYSYTYTCINETSSDTDSINVIVDCGVLSADVKANGSDTNITTFNPYTISWSSANADDCTLNGSAVALTGSQVEPATVEGDYPYNLACSNVCAGAGSDSVTVTVDFCGNGVCAGFENCFSCAVDCGACPSSWWQVWGGHLAAEADAGSAISSLIPSDTVCIVPACYPFLSSRDRAGTVNSDGLAMVAGGDISVNGRYSYRDPDIFAIGTIKTRLVESYSFFYSQYSLGPSPTEDFAATADDAQKPTTTKDYYFHSGDMTIQSPWAVTAPESYVVFVDGNLTISDPGGVDQLITVAEGGFLAFIVSGNITMSSNVGHTTLSNTAGNVEGVYVADGALIIATNSGTDERFVGEGTFVGWTNVVLRRDYRSTDNDLYPAQTFIYRPDFMKNTPEKMKRSQMLWQETN